MKNQDLIRYALKAFPRSTLWSSMVDVYKTSRDLSSNKLDELFYEFELYEQSHNSFKKNGIALLVDSKAKMDKRAKKKKMRRKKLH